jgi:hypothetical protein
MPLSLTPEVADHIGTGLVTMVFIIIAAKIFVPIHRQMAWRNVVDSWLGVTHDDEHSHHGRPAIK